MAEQQHDAFPGWASPKTNRELQRAKTNDAQNEGKKCAAQRRQRRSSDSRKRHRESSRHREDDASRHGRGLNHGHGHGHGSNERRTDEGHRRRRLQNRVCIDLTAETSSSSAERPSRPKSSTDEPSIEERRPPSSSLPWQNGYPIVPPSSERAMLPVLLRYGSSERGMIRDQPPSRVQTILRSCQTHGMRVDQALSLRRHHMKLLNPRVGSMAQLGLGENGDVRAAADLFERAVEGYLRGCGVVLRTEEEQRRMFRETAGPGDRMPPTPDFMLPGDVDLVSLQSGDADGACVSVQRGVRINWIEAKMFYGASTVPSGTSNAVGNILPTAKKYIKNYGPGAFIFSFGYGSQLKAELEALGISVLDAHPLDLRQMQDHQKGWCANKKGQILP